MSEKAGVSQRPIKPTPPRVGSGSPPSTETDRERIERIITDTRSGTLPMTSYDFEWVVSRLRTPERRGINGRLIGFVDINAIDVVLVDLEESKDAAHFVDFIRYDSSGWDYERDLCALYHGPPIGKRTAVDQRPLHDGSKSDGPPPPLYGYDSEIELLKAVADSHCFACSPLPEDFDAYRGLLTWAISRIAPTQKEERP